MAKLCLLLLLVSCAHDTQRANPLDPELTPASSLTAQIDESTGTTILRWGPYAGQTDFGAYWVLRNRVRQTQVDTIARLADVSQTSFVDTIEQGDEFVYRISVVNEAGLEVASTGVPIEPLSLPGSAITEVRTDSRSATATVTWTLYPGPRFASYRLERRSGSQQFETVHVSTDVGATTFVDSNLHGNVDYFYRVVLTTDREEEVDSDVVTGRFHQLVDAWAMDLPAEAGVRLNLGPDAVIEALVIAPEEVQLWVYDTGGSLLGQKVLHERSPLPVTGPPIRPEATFSALGSDGTRYLIVGSEDHVFVQQFDADGHIVRSDMTLFELEIDAGLTDGRVTVTPLQAAGVDGETILFGLPGGAIGFDDLTITAGSTPIIEEDFGQGLPAGWQIDYASNQGDLEIWPQAVDGAVITRMQGGSSLSRVHAGEDDLIHPGLAADVWMAREGAVTLALGRMRLLLHLSERLDRAHLTTGPGVYAATPDVHSLGQISLPVVPWVRYRMSLSAVDGQVTAILTIPYQWIDETDEALASWASGTIVDGTFAFTVADTRRGLADGRIRSTDTNAAATSDIRQWQVDDETWVAMCHAEENRVVVGRLTVGFTGALTWPTQAQATTFDIGTGLGSGDGQMVAPLSVARGPDGRFYVLDAGNARVQVFDADGTYVTQWRGSSDNSFDFGTGLTSTDLRGSIATDEDGFIYVADVGNRRILKFAP